MSSPAVETPRAPTPDNNESVDPAAPANILNPVLPAIAPAPIEDEHDSAYGDDSSTVFAYGSVTSSVYNFRKENGRTYHAYEDGKYLIPNDEREQDRMDLAYHGLQQLFSGKAFFAPVKDPQRIVDWGTGTGIWALDVGDQYPEAHVIGIDLSPIQPSWTAPNVEFRIDDLEKPWVIEKPVDLVHSRVCAGNAIKNWPAYFAEAYKTLRPGGWVESQEFYLQIYSDDDSIPEPSKIRQWTDKIQEGLMIVGSNSRVSGSEIKQHCLDAGFVNVEVIDMKWPISPWPQDKRLKEVGAFGMVSMVDDLSGISLAIFTRILQWDRIELELFLGEVKKEWKSKAMHAYWPVFVVYGQKPLDAST